MLRSGAVVLLPVGLGLSFMGAAPVLANISKAEIAGPAHMSLADLRAQEIRLRNAIDQSPGNGSLRINLAKVYLQLGNFNAALAEVTLARQLKVKDEIVAPLQAELMNDSGAFADLLREVPEGSRPPKVESIVRTYRGLAQLAIGEMDAATTSLSDAERLDPTNTRAKTSEARVLLGKKQSQLAEKKVDEVLAAVPSDTAALELKGLMLQMRGDTAGALKYFDKALSGGRINVQVLLDRANLEASRNDLAKAAKDLDLVRSAAPNSPSAAYVDAVIKARSGNFQAADEAIGKMRDAMPYLPGAYFLAGEIKFKLNQFGQAEDYLVKFIAQEQDQPQAYALLGFLALRRGDSARAVTMLEKAHSLAPQDTGTAIMLSQAYLGHGEPKQALRVMDDANVREPNNAAVVGQLALSHFALGEPGASVEQLSSLFKSGAGQLTAGPSLILAQLRRADVAGAAKTAHILVQRDPANMLYKQLLGATLVAQRNYPAAEAVFKEVLAKQPSTLAARRGLAGVYLATNRGDAAVALFQAWITKNPQDPKLKEALAEIYTAKKDYDSAAKLLSDPAVAAAGGAGGGLELDRVYEIQGRWPEAIKTANDLAKRFPNNETVMDALGRVYSRSGDAKASVATYATATAAFPNSAPLWNNYATALAAAKNSPAALDAISKAYAIEPNNLTYTRAYIDLTYSVKGGAAATDIARAIDAKAPQAQRGTLLLASTLARYGKRAEAVALLEPVYGKSTSADAVMMLSRFYVADGKAPKAIAVLEAWDRAHPNTAQVRFGLAQLYGSAGAYPQALKQFEWLALQQPTNTVVLNNLAWLYSQKHDNRAQAVAEKAFRLAPGNGAIADTLGWILVNRGDAAGAVKYLQTAAHAQPQDGTIQYHLAFALAKSNQAANARPLLQNVLKSDAPNDVKQQAKALLVKIGS
jgi:putative PEP-CTERM system TPR-repeat lipoprotein